MAPSAQKAPRELTTRVVRGEARPREARFNATFTLGNASGCDVRFEDPHVAARHAQVVFDGVLWWVRDLGSAGGTYVDGARVQLVPLTRKAQVQLGEDGPALSIAAAEAGRSNAVAPEPQPGRARSETEIIERYLTPSTGGPAGRETVMIRRAFARVQKRSSRRYRGVIAACALALIAAGAIIAHQHHKLQALRATAERLFYAAKALELQTAKSDELVLLHADPQQVAELDARRAKLETMEKEYDGFVGELGVYGKVPDRHRVILRVARLFGECEVNVPSAFLAEVQRYVERWRSSGRLARAIERVKARGYARTIARTLIESNLPPQYIYLAAQESGFDERAVGPATRYGYAKGMWQFIPATARRYGLRLGPLQDEPIYDARDERFDWEKASAAAARYLKDLQSTEAQASGLVAMACYNWGEDGVRGVISALPANPQDRNFWRLLADRKVPRETYDYVLSIFSAAVICEDPKLFGFDLECPALRDAGGPPTVKR